MYRWMIAICVAACAHAPAATKAEAAERVEDLDWLLAKIAHDDPYVQDFEVGAIRAHYLARAQAAGTRALWVGVLEDVIGELYDHHVSLGTNTQASPRLVPSGTDLWGEVVGERAVITEVRLGTAAERAGLRAGMAVTAIAGRPIGEAIAARRPAIRGRGDAEAASWAFRVLLAGTHDGTRRLTACAAGHAECRDYVLEAPDLPDAASAVTARLDGEIGYLRIENRLGDSETVAAFDAALATLGSARGLILDLRNTPSGGTTEVAEPILGRFVDAAGGYQQVIEPGRAPWIKQLEPRPPFEARPLVVLVDHWTGSMGEGMAIGLDARHRATVIGTRMAGLRGGIASVTLPHTKIPVRFQNERLMHVDGTPRERWAPPIVVDPVGDGDPILARGLRALHE